MDHGQVHEERFPSRCVCEEVEDEYFDLIFVVPAYACMYFIVEI